jgi:uncharacterized protein YutE (UPF0331/DUF86 family)
MNANGACVETDLQPVSDLLDCLDARLEELRVLARPEQIDEDVRERRFVPMTVQMLLNALRRLAFRLAALSGLNAASDGPAPFGLLADDGWIPSALVAELESLEALRDAMIRDYRSTHADALRGVVCSKLAFVSTFVAHVRPRLMDLPS